MNLPVASGLEDLKDYATSQLGIIYYYRILQINCMTENFSTRSTLHTKEWEWEREWDCPYKDRAQLYCSISRPKEMALSNYYWHCKGHSGAFIPLVIPVFSPDHILPRNVEKGNKHYFRWYKSCVCYFLLYKLFEECSQIWIFRLNRYKYRNEQEVHYSFVFLFRFFINLFVFIYFEENMPEGGHEHCLCLVRAAVL